VLETPVAAQVQVGSTSLEVFSRGSEGAPTLLFLHDLDYLNGVEYAFIEALAERWRMLAPSHPGFGGSALPEDFDSVGDLAYVYLDWLRDLGPVHLVGAGFGGWIAAEVAVRCSHNLKTLTLVDALGIKVSDRTTADIKDVFVLSPRELVEACWHAAERGEREMPLPVASKGFDEDTLTRLLTNRRTAALLGWNPFMYDPKLRSRLRYLDLPTLVVWGESDRLVMPDYGRAYANAIPGARFALIRAAGHYPYLEQPADFVSSLDKHLHQAA
jgi:pimeloyl-ACP methyl ester carboxylesterase